MAAIIQVTFSNLFSWTQIAISRVKLYTKLFLWHDDVIKWKYFPRYWPFVREIHRSPVNFPHKGQWRGALMFTLICARKNGWVNNGEAGDLRRYLAHYDVIVMGSIDFKSPPTSFDWEFLTEHLRYDTSKTHCNTSILVNAGVNFNYCNSLAPGKYGSNFTSAS